MSSYVRDTIKALTPENKALRSDYYNFGYEYCGPFLFGFTQWLICQIKADHLSNVFFFSRDGFMMKKAFDALNDDDSIKSRYVYFSRKSLQKSLLWKTGNYLESTKYLTASRLISLGNILEYYGFTSAEIAEILADVKLPENYNFEYKKLSTNETLKKIYNKYEKTILARSKNQFDLLNIYLKQIGLTKSSGIVDIGWHGNMQKFLNEVLLTAGYNINITGYYVGINSKPSVGKTKGFLFNNNEMHLRKDVLCFLGGYEKLLQSQEGSTFAYCKNGNLIAPVLGKYEYENDDINKSHIEEWQSGTMDFIIAMLKMEPLDIANIKLWAMPLMNFGKRPTTKGVRLFAFFYTNDGSKDFFVSQKSILKYAPGEFLDALSKSLWKTGFLKSVFKLPLPYFCIYKAMRK